MDEGKNMPKNRNNLLEACARHTLSEQDAEEIANEGDQRGRQIVIREAYIPYIPPQWNGYLVLAEAQNLANTDDVRRLLDLPSRRRMNRFANGPAMAPWDDGLLPCAIEAAFGVNSRKTAVSNAVPWSRIKPDGNNENPSEEMEDQAVRFWEDLLPLINPTHIITAGKVAETVIERADPESRYCRKNVRLPSPRAMNLISGMFNTDDLLRRYPEVQQVVQRNPKKWLKRNIVFFACHVVSLYGQGQNDG